MFRSPRIHLANMPSHIVQRGRHRDARFFAARNDLAAALCMALFTGWHATPATASDMAMQRSHQTELKGADAPLPIDVQLPADRPATNELLLAELTAGLIETSKYQDFPEGITGAILYLSKPRFSKFATSSGSIALEDELASMRRAEAKIVRGFRVFLPKGDVRVTLTKEEKTDNIGFLIEPICYLLALRNEHIPDELKKIALLKDKEDTSDHTLSISFKQNNETGLYFIQNIQILETQ